MRKFLRDESGGPAAEAALLVALVAAVAGFGMVTFGDALSTFYTSAGNTFSPGAVFPSQCGDSQTLKCPDPPA